MAKRKPAEGEAFRFNGEDYTIVRVRKNRVGVSQVDMDPDNAEECVHDHVSVHADEAVFVDVYDAWVLPGRDPIPATED